MGNEFMNLSINANGFSNVQNTAAGNKAEQANKQGKSAFLREVRTDNKKSDRTAKKDGTEKVP